MNKGVGGGVELKNRNVEHNDEETTAGTSKMPNSMGIRIV
jgi:hypothetical protein